MGGGFDIVLSDDASSDERAEFEARLSAFDGDAMGYRDSRSLSCSLRNPRNELVAGIDGFTEQGYLAVGETTGAPHGYRELTLQKRLVRGL